MLKSQKIKREAFIMSVDEKKLMEEIKKMVAAKVSSSDEPGCKCCGKTPMETRWNVESKDKPVEA